MTVEKILGGNASYLRRLGALSAIACGLCAVLGAALVVMEPTGQNAAATAFAAVIALLGAGMASRS